MKQGRRSVRSKRVIARGLRYGDGLAVQGGIVATG
jgi:hypothetical protein